MVNWALAFLLGAMLAAMVGFTGIALAAAGFAKAIFFLCMMLFLAALIANVVRRESLPGR